MNKATTIVISIVAVLALILSGVAIYLLVGISGEVSSLRGEVSNLTNLLEEASSSVESIGSKVENLTEEINKLKNPPKFPLTVVDALGRTVIVEEEPMRIVSMAPSVTEVLFALGLDDKVVGVTEYCDYPDKVLELVNEGKIQVIGGFTTPSVEKIVALNPDLVIGCKIHEKFIPLLESLGVNVLIVGDESVDDVYKSILLIGKACGVEDKALNLVNSLKSSIRNVWDKVKDATKPSVLIIVWLKPLWVAGKKTYMDDLISFAGGINAYSGEGWKSIDAETLLKLNPDIIIITGHAAPGQSPEEMLEYLKETIPGWENISAVTNDRVYFLTGNAENALVRPGPRIASAIEVLAKIIHPEIFGEVDHIISEIGFIIQPIIPQCTYIVIEEWN